MMIFVILKNSLSTIKRYNYTPNGGKYGKNKKNCYSAE